MGSNLVIDWSHSVMDSRNPFLQFSVSKVSVVCRNPCGLLWHG